MARPSKLTQAAKNAGRETTGKDHDRAARTKKQAKRDQRASFKRGRDIGAAAPEVRG